MILSATFAGVGTVAGDRADGAVAAQATAVEYSLSAEDGVVGNGSVPDPWRIRQSAGTTEVSTAHASDGSKSIHVRGGSSLGTSEVAVDVNLTGVSNVTMDVYITRTDTYAGEINLRLGAVGDNQKLQGWTLKGEEVWHNDSTANVSAYTGEHTLVFHARGDGNGGYFDDVRFYDTQGRQLSPADVVVGLNDTGPATEDIALESKGATASASTWGTYNGWESRPSGAIDDVHANHDYAWGGTSGAGDWLEIDLNSTYSIDRINVDNGYHSLNYTVEVSTDGSTWEPVAVDHFSPGDHYIDDHRANNDTFELNGQQVRYVRISVLGTNAPSSHIWQAIIEEVEVFPTSDGASDALEANFSFTSRPLTAGTTELINASASSDPDGTITDYAWDFDGDNQTDATGVESSYSFDTSGTHDVTLTVFDDDGNTANLTKTVTVEAPAPPEAPPKTGVSTGDPHLITFDGLAYDFQAAGEFVLVRESGGSLAVQARQVPVGDSTDVTVNTAVATRLDGHTLTVDARDATAVSVDGGAVAVNATAPLSVGDGRVFYDDGATAYTVVYPGADGEVDAGDTQLVADVVGDRIDVTVHVDPSDHDRLTGLLGDADGGPADDLALANGATLSRPPSFDALYGPFRTSWRVNESTSLFDYENGTGPSTYYDADVPAESVTLADFDDAAVEDARQKALDAGLTEGTVNFRNALIDYLLTGDQSYFDSAAAAPETPESNLTVPSDPVRNLTGATVDGFEDGTLAEYVDVDSAETTTATVYAGNRSLVITDRNDDIDTDAQGLIGNTINRTFDPTAPSRLTAAIRADSGAYNTVAVQWKNASGSVIHGTRVLNYYDGLYYGGTSGTTLQSASGYTWYYVELVDVDWEADVVGEIRVNGQRRARNVSFVNPGDSVSEVRLVVHDGSTGSVGYFDEVTVGGAAPAEDGPTVDVAVDDPVPVGTTATINVTGTGVSELRITGETADWVVNDTRPSTLATYPPPGELPYTGQADDTWAQLYSAPGTHSFEVVATPPAGSGTYNFTATGLRNGTSVERTFAVEVRRGEHESGVSYRLFDAVAGDGGTLERADVIAALRGYLSDGTVAGVALSREDVIALVQYYLVQ